MLPCSPARLQLTSRARHATKDLNSYLTNHIQLDRAAKSLAETSAANASGVISRILGFQHHVCAQEGQPTLAWLTRSTPCTTPSLFHAASA